MKKLIIILLLLPNILIAQQYVEFISTSDSSDTWKDITSCTDLNCYDSSTKVYTIDGDTTIGSYQFAKLMVREQYKQGADQGQSCPSTNVISNYYYGALRESAKQIFIKPSGQPEYMAYDFNLTIGDTIPSPANANISVTEPFRIIDSIDSVIVNGVYRKRYWLERPWSSPTEYIIEGVGASWGVFNRVVDPNWFDCYNKMQCYTEYGIIGHFNDNCELNLGVDELHSDKSPPELVKIVDYLGREINEKPNTMMIYIYSDGSSVKVFKME